MKKTFKYTATALMLAGAFGVASQAQAATIGLDSFSELSPNGSRVTDDGDPLDTPTTGAIENLTAASHSASLSGVTRVAEALATGPNGGTSESISLNYFGSGKLSISNTDGSAGTATLLYNFDPIDFAALGATAISLDVLTIDTGVSVQMTINGDASTAFQPFSGPGQFYALFSAFTGGIGADNFSNATSLELNFTGGDAWDGSFDNLRADVPPSSAPEPAALALIGLGLAGFAAARKKKQA